MSFVFAESAPRIDVRWYKSVTGDSGGVQEQAVYQWHEFYDGILGFGDE